MRSDWQKSKHPGGPAAAIVSANGLVVGHGELEWRPVDVAQRYWSPSQVEPWSVWARQAGYYQLLELA